MGDISNPPRLVMTTIPVASFTVPAGAAAYIDTNVSATTGTNTARAWVINGRAAAQNVGARAHGTAGDPNTFSNNSVTLLSAVDSAGHMDLMRNAAGDSVYEFIGYLEIA